MIRKEFWVLCLVTVLFSCTKKEPVTIQKIEHVYVSSKNAERSFNLLTEEFGLPVVWDYQDWGSFKSGGASLGNVVIELIENNEAINEKYYGVALEPSHTLKSMLPYLDSAQIAHGAIGKAARWSTMSLVDLLPNEINLFLCDYHDRASVNLNRESARKELFESGGGSLGIEYVQAITIGAENPAQYVSDIQKLPGIIKEESALDFSQGPKLELEKSGSLTFSLLIKVKSIEKAKTALDALSLKTHFTNQGVEIMDEALSLKITLVE